MTPVAVASSSSSGFSVTLLLAAGAAGAAWIATLGAVMVVRRPPRIGVTPGAGGLATPPEPPAVAGLLCDDFVVGAEAAPATLLDLAARHVVTLEEVQPGNTVCRLRDRDAGPLTPYEQMVVDHLRGKALGGVVPADALTTGTDDVSQVWHRRFAAMSSPMRSSGGSRVRPVAGACRRTARRGRARRRRTVVRGGRGRR